MSLVGNMKDVGIGDIVLLGCANNKGSSVVGFVIELKEDKITLSTQQYYFLKERDTRKLEISLGAGSPTTFFSGDKKYSLDYFDDYKILSKYQGERVLKMFFDDVPYVSNCVGKY